MSFKSFQRECAHSIMYGCLCWFLSYQMFMLMRKRIHFGVTHKGDVMSPLSVVVCLSPRPLHLARAGFCRGDCSLVWTLMEPCRCPGVIPCPLHRVRHQF